MAGHRFQPHALDEDDEGYDAANFGARMRGQDQEFCEAMRRAIKRKKEKAIEGIKVADQSEARALTPVRAETFVPTQSMLENV
jgi:hypothetical protein